jgi:hypothetical protein
MHPDSPLLQILLTKFEAEGLLDVLPPGEEQRKLRNKIVACGRAIDFLKANSESARQFLARVPAVMRRSRSSERHVA